MKLLEFIYDNQKYAGFIQEDYPDIINIISDKDDLYTIITSLINNNIPLTNLASRVTNTLLIADINNKLIFLPPMKPEEKLFSFVNGMGLTHKRIASIRYSSDNIPIQGEWFYKGNGTILKTTADSLYVPPNAYSCTEEAEIVLIYVIDALSIPYRIGYTLGNDFSDPKMGKTNHAYFGQSKLRTCSIAPEIKVGEPPLELIGNVIIKRNNEYVWRSQFVTGINNMLYSLEKIESLVFQHDQFLIPGMVHYLFLGADTTSYSHGIRLMDGDIIDISSSEFTFNLINHVNFAKNSIQKINIESLSNF
ncbi:MAG: hypothetical protein EPO11_10685 [Gammaproteobacteria bacterium]|nr:MAG: hypothetical protein EPO11_10685 [Gammaproteobacteria bacterium]